MADTKLDNMVLTFEEYIDFQEKFGNTKNVSSDAVDVNEILERANITGNDKENYKKAFDVLLNHIHRHGLFFYDENPDACKYINYILYEQVERKDHQSYNDKLIKLFDKFLEAYGKNHGKQKRCASKIYSINDQTYNKINELYKVYDKYKLCYRFDEKSIQWGCVMFEDFFDSYDNYMLGIESNSLAFNNILQKIQQDAEKALTLYRTKCKDYSKNLYSPRLYKHVPVQIPEKNYQEQTRQTGLQSADSVSHSETQGIAHTQEQTQLPNVISVSHLEQENQRTVEENSVNVDYSENVGHNANIDHIANYSHRGSSHQLTTYPHLRANEEKTQILPKFQPHFRHSYPSGQHEHVEEQTVSNEEVLSPPSVMSTISSALKDVDPVPVVGVSGGMGVLFLLFKYTPVGTFFRGRGYRQRIPTRFEGVYPGFMTDFQGYGDGYFPNDRINITYGRE